MINKDFSSLYTLFSVLYEFLMNIQLQKLSNKFSCIHTILRKQFPTYLLFWKLEVFYILCWKLLKFTNTLNNAYKWEKVPSTTKLVFHCEFQFWSYLNSFDLIYIFRNQILQYHANKADTGQSKTTLSCEKYHCATVRMDFFKHFKSLIR